MSKARYNKLKKYLIPISMILLTFCFVQYFTFASSTATVTSGVVSIEGVEGNITNSVPIYYPSEFNIFNYAPQSKSARTALMQVSITTTVTKKNGEIITNDPNVDTVLVLENGETVVRDTDINSQLFLRYALLAPYKYNGERVNNKFYFLVTAPSLFSNNLNITPFKVKTYIDDELAPEYRQAKIKVDVEVRASQMLAYDNSPDSNDVADIYNIHLTSPSNPDYFSVPLPIAGTTNEYSTKEADRNTLDKRNEVAALLAAVKGV